MKRKSLDRSWNVIHCSTVKTGKLKGLVLGNSNDYDYWWESLTEEDVYWSGMTENDRLYGLELKPEVDIASYELRKMADAREQYTEGRFAVLSNLIREITDCEVEWAKREIQCLTRTSIEKMEDNLFDVLRVVDRAMYPN